MQLVKEELVDLNVRLSAAGFWVVEFETYPTLFLLVKKNTWAGWVSRLRHGTRELHRFRM